MSRFVFSCDAHVAEPNDLFTAGLPANLRQWAAHAEFDDAKGMRLNMLGDTVLFKIPVAFHSHKVGDANDIDVRRRGARDLKLRLADMHRDGIDAELVFPSLGVLASRIPDRDAARESARLYNDWLWNYVTGLRSTLVPAAMVPLVNLEDGIAELKQVIAKGFPAVMMPMVGMDTLPLYNDPAWDAFFAICAEAEVPLVFHTAIGNVNIRPLRGPGGALFNYTRQMNDAVDVITLLVSGGVLDRNPKAKIMFAECGAGWLLALGERMDEVYHGHAPSIQPKLSRLPSEIVREQVRCSFQNDPGCLLTLKKMSVENFLFASDYPHSEGTFPFSRKVIAEMFDQVPEMSEEDRAAVLGLNAAKLFKISPQVVAEETKRFLAAA